MPGTTVVPRPVIRGPVRADAEAAGPPAEAPPAVEEEAAPSLALSPMGEDDGRHDERDGLAAETLDRVREAAREADLRALMAKAPAAEGLDPAGAEGWRLTPHAFREGPPQAITHVPAGERDADEDVGYFAYGKLKAPILTVPDKLVADEDDARNWFHAALVDRAATSGMTLPRPVRAAYGLAAT